MKKCLTLCLCLTALLCLIFITTPKAEAATYGDLYYTVSNGKVTITDCKTSATGALTIPATIEGYPVTTIGDYAFRNCTSLTGITIPDSVTTIGKGAFYECTGLTSVTIGDSVTTIGEAAFYNCYRLPAVTIPDSVTTICDATFYQCTSLTSVTLPKSVAIIGTWAFNGCTNLTSINIPDAVTTIGYAAFEDCESLTDVQINDLIAWCNIEFIDDYTSNPLCYGASLYLNGELVTDLIIPTGVTAIGNYAFYNCTSLTSVTIPDGVTRIGYSAFSGCASLTSITIPDSVTSIDQFAFSYCTRLTSIAIGDSLTRIDYGAFWSCTSLQSITIPESVTMIDQCAFINCTSLTSVTILGNVTYIGRSAFKDCTGLTTVYITDLAAWCNILFGNTDANPLTYAKKLYLNGKMVTELNIPDGVTTISNDAFYNCTSLTSVTIPDSVTAIGNDAFYNCSGLKNVYITNPNAWCKVGFGNDYANPLNYADNGHILDTAGNELTEIVLDNSVTAIPNYAFRNCTSLTTVTIDKGVVSIGELAFRGCKSLNGIWVNKNNPNYCSDSSGVLFNKNMTELIVAPCTIQSYVIPDSVTTIDSSAFYCCTHMVSIVIPNGVTVIEDYVFQECSGLTSITFPNRVTTIGDYAFSGCTSLTSITIPNGVTSLGSYAFKDCASLTNVIIPSMVSYIDPCMFRNCSNLSGIWVNSNNPNFSNDEYGVVFNKNKTELICAPGKLTGHYTIPDSVTAIGFSAFHGCTNLTGVTIPDGVTTIEEQAFANCTALQFNIYNNGKYLGNENNPYAYFIGVVSDSISEIAVHPKTKVIGNSAFKDRINLTKITIPDSVKVIGYAAFSGCGSLESMTIPFVGASYKTPKSEYDCVFGYIFGHASYAGGIAIEQYYYYDSNGPKSLGTYYIPESLKSVTVTGGSIMPGAFSYCRNLTNVIIGDKVTSIGIYAFYRCSGLKYVDIHNGSIGNYAFADCTSLTSVTLGGKTLMGSYVFRNCTSLTSVVIGEGVTTIGVYAFYGCTSLTDITIPDSVTTIGNMAFYNCTSLTSIAIPGSVISVDANAFYYCTGLTSVYITDLDAWCNISFGNTDANPLSYAKKLYLHGELVTNLNIPEDVVAIGNCAFYNCTSLTSVTIPGSVTSIGDSAFYNCTSLTSVTIPGSVTSIGKYAFYRCTSLIGVYITDLVGWCGINFDDFAANPLYYAQTLYLNGVLTTDLVIPDGVITIGDSAFRGCKSLTSITIPDSVTSIGNLAFFECGILDSIIIPCSVTTIGDSAFGLTSLKNVYYAGNRTQWENIDCDGADLGYPTIHYNWHKHVFTDYVSNNDATCTTDGTMTAQCNRCEVTDTITDIGSANGAHSFTNYTSNNDATCIADGTKTANCDYCDASDSVTDTGSALGHSFTEYVSNNDATYFTDGTKTATCSCGATDTVVDDGSRLTPEGNMILLQPENVTTDSGETVTFSIEAFGEIVSYQWQYRKVYKWFDTTMEGYNTDTLTVPATGARNSYDYRCVVTFADGTVLISELAELIVNTQINIIYHPNDQTAVLGHKGQFTASAEGEGIKYQWQYCRPDSEKWIDTAMDGATKPTVYIETTTARNGYQYRCRITDVTGKIVYTEPATMRVLSFTAHPEEKFAPVNGTVQFTITASATEGFTYQWQYRRSETGNWTNTTMTGYNTDTLTVSATKAHNGYQYRCVLTGAKSSKIESKAAVLHVGDPVVFTTQPANVTCAVGSVATFTVAAQNAYSYQWQYMSPAMTNWKNTTAAGNQTATLNVTVKSNNNGYKYRCVVTGLDGNQYTCDPATLTFG